MRIISKFHDYYDSAMAQGIDTSLIYKRERELLWIDGASWSVPSNLAKLFEEYPFRHYQFEYGAPRIAYLVFCGKAYPYWLSSAEEIGPLVDAIELNLYDEIVSLDSLIERSKKLDKQRHTFRSGWGNKLDW